MGHVPRDSPKPLRDAYLSGDSPKLRREAYTARDSQKLRHEAQNTPRDTMNDEKMFYDC